MTTVTTPDSAVVTTSYSGNTVTVMDQAGKQRKSVTDGLGRLVQVYEAPNDSNYNYLTNYSYDALDNLTGVSQGSQPPRTFVYDSLKRLLSATNPESGTINYQYDNNGNLTWKTDPRLLADNVTHVKVTYDYDGLNRIKTRTYNDGTPGVTYAYDALGIANSKGRLTSVSSSVSTYSYSGYDALGRVLGGTQTTDGVAYSMSYSYNLAGAMISQTYPSGRVVATDYDSAGRVAGVKNQAIGSFYAGAASTDLTNRMQYSAAGAVQVMKLGNGLWEHATFNSRLQPTQIGLGTASTNSSVLQLDYSYGTTNNNGNLQSQTITAPTLALTQSYTYDQVNRLKSAEEMNGATQSWKQTFIYDRYGNRTFDAANTTIPAPLTNLIVNPLNNRFDPTAAGQSLISYDNAGNLTREVAGNTYGYDGANRMTGYNGGNPATGGASYAYDGDGRRVKKITSESTTIFVYDAAGQLVAEYTNVVPAPSTWAGISYLTADPLGTPRVITRADGTVKSRHDYLPFGEELFAGTSGRTTSQGYGNNDGMRQKFTQKERDNETGLDFFEARYYASMHGRFTSPDEPFADQFAENPQSWNLYSYVRNNPLVMVDPTGRRTGDYYDSNGNWVFTDNINDNKVYLVTQVNEPDGSINYIPQLLGITHTQLRIIANIVRQEAGTADAQESLWIAHTSNNEASAIHSSLYDLLQTRFSSAGDKVNGIATNDSSDRANAARAGVLDVLAGGHDPTGGARRWDGTDFLAWGLNGPWGSHAKFREFAVIDIPGDTYSTYESAQTARWGNSVSYPGRGTYTLPAAVFTNTANWTAAGDFHYVTGARNQTRTLTATGAKGQTIFWRF